MTSLQIAVDIGGTFTDVVIVHTDGKMEYTKVPSDPDAPARAVAAVLDRIRQSDPGATWEHVLHATTIGTNALLERKTPNVALVTTKGFRDVLQFRRLKRANLYSIDWDPSAPLVSRDRIFEIDERIGARGEVITPLSAAELDRLAEFVRGTDAPSIAVCLLHSYVNETHERTVAQYLADEFPDRFVTTSAEVAPQIGEYERTSSTVVHAALKPVLSEYVGELEAAVRVSGSSRLLVMQSNGGLATSRQIVEEPGRAIESGPAAGAMFAAGLMRQLEISHAIAFDMGGTTAKACLLEQGTASETGRLRVGGEVHTGEGFKEGGGYVITGTAIDLVEVGAGGGSLCQVDDQGVLHVGPASAGAVPGPVAYGRGGEVPTVTDANLVLGYLPEGNNVAGVSLDGSLARDAVAKHVAEPLGVSVEEAAWLVVQVANSNMMRAIQAVSSERGRDLSQYALVAFGGAGPTHAAAIAEELGMKEVIIPLAPEVFSAVGLHSCSVRRDAQQPVMLRASDVDRDDLERQFLELEEKLKQEFLEDGLVEPTTVRQLEVRFVGQSTALSIAAPTRGDRSLEQVVHDAYVAAHESEYGHADEHAEVEIVAARVRAESSAGAPGHVSPTEIAKEAVSTQAYFGQSDGWHETPRLAWAAVADTDETPGPLLIHASQAVVMVPPGVTARRHPGGHLRLLVKPRSTATLSGGGWEGRAGLQLFRNALGAILDRMAFTVGRAAYSTLASETNDFSVAIGDAEGRVVDQGIGILMHLGSVASALKALMASDLVPLRPGDVVLLNDPYSGGTHLPDCIVVVPVFVEGRLTAHTVAIAHMIDIGGLVAGSHMASAKELLQEGLIIPPVKLYDRGAPHTAVFDIIRRNVRQPAEVIGDLQGLVAAAKLGARSIEQLIVGSGRSHALGLMADLIEYAEERGQQELRSLGTAEGEFTDFVDSDGNSDDPIRIQVRLRIEQGVVAADFTGSSPQRLAGINCTLSTTRSVLQSCIRTQMTEDYPDNVGFDRLVEITTRPGTVVDATDDAPVAGRGMTAYRVADCIFGAMAQMFPGRIWAAGDGSLDPLTFGGRRDDGSRFTLVDIVGGTGGARPRADGMEGVAQIVGNGRNQSVEVLEARYPIRITHYGMVPGTAGKGQYRGGNAVTRGYELLCDEAEVVIRSDRKIFPPWGLDNGEAGAPSRNLLYRRDGTEVELPSKHSFTLHRGERLTRQGPGGGGYGDPSLRSPDARTRDRREGRSAVDE